MSIFKITDKPLSGAWQVRGGGRDTPRVENPVMGLDCRTQSLRFKSLGNGEPLNKVTGSVCLGKLLMSGGLEALS